MKKLITAPEFRELISAGVKDFSGYRMKVTELYCGNNQLTSLPDLPMVIELDCYNNNLTALPDLPNVTKLYCRHNRLTALPELPNVTKLYCDYNQLTSLPELPNVTELYCGSNKLTALPNYTDSQTSGRSVYFTNGKILTGCFCGTPKEFYQKGFIEEKKQWVADFCVTLKKSGLI